MQFLNTLFLAASALASLAAANSIHFINQDSTPRTIIFTPSLGLATIPNLSLKGSGSATANFPTGWIGNWYSVNTGSRTDIPGMLGEVRFDGFAGATYFDVSAIVNPKDGNGVKMIMPKVGDTPVSGCQSFPCDNAYNHDDDVRTISTPEKELICLVGNESKDRKRGMVARTFVLE